MKMITVFIIQCVNIKGTMIRLFNLENDVILNFWDISK